MRTRWFAIPLVSMLAGLACSPAPKQPEKAAETTPAAAAGEKPPALLKGLGIYSHTIQTSNPEAQQFFDQGLNLMYGFNRYESLRSFRKASELDPKALMPYWGIAMASGPHVNMDLDMDVDMKASCAAVEQGRAVSASAPDYERAYLEAVASRCPEYEPARYIAAMRALTERFPDDQDGRTLYAESLMLPVRWKWWSNGKPAAGVREAEQALEEVMRRNNVHPGANHFYIHAVESSPNPERAIPSAQRLMGIVPGAGHLLHMPGHIWLVMGDYQRTVEVNERAAEVDREYMETTGVRESSYAGYYVHNLHFIAVAQSMLGRKQATVEAAQVVHDAAAPFVGMMPMMVDAFIPLPIFARLRFQMWDEVLAAPAPDARLLASTAMWHYARGVAFAAQGNRAEGERERAAFAEAAAKVPANWIWLNNKSTAMVAIAAAVLDAKLAASDSASVPHWRKAVALEDALVYDEPPPWFFPLREGLGGALLRAGQAAEAETVFRDGLRRKPGNGRMLFGLVESLKAQGKDHAAGLVQKEFEEAWKRADVTARVADL